MKKWFFLAAVLFSAVAYAQTDFPKRNRFVAETVESSSIKLYANPSGKYLRIESEEGSMKHIELYDGYGRKVQAYSNPDSDKVTIYTGKLLPAIYYVRVLTAKGLSFSKVLIERTIKVSL